MLFFGILAIVLVAWGILAVIHDDFPLWVINSVAIFVIVLLIAFCSFASLDSGHVGIVRTFGKITNQTGSGLVTIWPWQSLDDATIQVNNYALKGVQAASGGKDKEIQNVYADVTVRYEVSPEAIQGLYTHVGDDYVNKLLPPDIQNFFKEEVVKYNAIDVLPSREQIRTNFRDKLKMELAPYSITVDDVLVENVHFDDAFTHAIEDKQVQTQLAEAEQNKVAIAKAQGDQKAAAASGEAQAIGTINTALANSPNYIAYIQAQAGVTEANKFASSWDGHLPTYWAGSQGNGAGVFLPVPSGK